MIYILPYKLGSQSAKLLGQGLNALRISGKKRLNRRATVINWGNSDVTPVSRWGRVRTINNPEAVILAKNKLLTFTELTKKGITTVPFTTSITYAQGWLNNNETVFCRDLVTSSRGRGIRVITPDTGTLPYSRLYTKYLPRCHEYRVHVFRGQVIDFTKKKKRSEATVNEYIRNTDNGWVFCREGIVLPEKLKDISIRAVNALGLDFGAVDVLYKEMSNSAWILEINSAPGIEGSTLNKYLEQFRKVL